jgi:hypothetical protein
MIPPGKMRPGKAYRQGVIQILLTRQCDLACYNCTQGSQYGGEPATMTPEQFEVALQSLDFQRGDGKTRLGDWQDANNGLPGRYFGVVGVFGGNPTVSKHFEACCEIMREYVPFEQRGLWSNNSLGKGKVCAATFNAAVSNINVHMSQKAWDEWKRDWPESQTFGLDRDSRHSPGDVAMVDLEDVTESERWDAISRCKINQEWSAMIAVFRGRVTGFFCERAGNLAVRHQAEETWPESGILAVPGWWREGILAHRHDVAYICHRCSIPLSGRGELALSTDPASRNQASRTHESICKPKRKDQAVEFVTLRTQLGVPLGRMTDYIGNSTR